MNIEVPSIPDGHIVVGSVSVLKMLDTDGQDYWAMRPVGVNDMEAFGMVMFAADMCRLDLQECRRMPGDH